MTEPLDPNGTEGTLEESSGSLSAISVQEVIIPQMDIGELTQVNEEGTGVLDVLIRNLKLNLDREWEQERITGPEYARAFIELYQSTLQIGLGYVTARSRLGYEITNLQNDAKYKEAQIEIAKAQLEKIPHEIAMIIAQTDQVAAQTGLTGAQTSQVEYETSARLPVEVANLGKQGELIEQQVAESTYRVANVLPKELEEITAQIANLGKQGEMIDAQVAQTTAETSTKLPAEVSNLTKQGELLTQQVAESTYRVANVLPKELEMVTAQVSQLEANLTKVPHEINILKSQDAQIIAETTLTGTRNQLETANLAKVPVEVELLRKESLRADAQITLVNKQVEQLTAEMTKIPVEVEVLTKQSEAAAANIAYTEAQTEHLVQETLNKLPIEIANLGKQGLQLDAETTLTTHQSALTELQATKIPTEIELLQAEIASRAKQNLILEREYELKVGELELQAKNLQLAAAELDLRREELKVKAAQIKAQEAQANLYEQKVVTERAQVDNTVVNPDSVIDLSNQVLKAQVKGYAYDAQNRLAKLMVDVFSVTYQGGEREVNTTNKLTDTEMGRVMTKMFTELGV